MKKLLPVVFFLIAAAVSGESLSASKIMNAALEKESVQEGIEYISSSLDSCATAADKRSILYFLGNMQELSCSYADASYSYAVAAGIGAADAEGMPAVSSEQLVLCAVRASLNAGDWETAQKYLNSAVRSSKNEKILAAVNLYAVWADLCQAKDIDETADSVAILKAYVSMQSMKSQKCAVLFTLWYLTADSQYSDVLKKEYPDSLEAGIVNGTAQIMSSPFWYFVPREIHEYEAVPESSSHTVPATVTAAASESTSSESEANSKVKAQQLGLFKDKANAEALVQQAKEKGFNAYCTEEKKASGNVYYLVLVDENSDESMGMKLRSAGFECCPVFQ